MRKSLKRFLHLSSKWAIDIEKSSIPRKQEVHRCDRYNLLYHSPFSASSSPRPLPIFHFTEVGVFLLPQRISGGKTILMISAFFIRSSPDFPVCFGYRKHPPAAFHLIKMPFFLAFLHASKRFPIAIPSLKENGGWSQI